MSAVGTNRRVSMPIGDPARRDVADVAFAGQEPLDLRLVDVEAHRAEAGLDEGLDQRHADIAQADHADFGRLGVDGITQ